MELVACAFCGYAFEPAELVAHRASCGQRRWMDLNFACEPTERPPKLVVLGGDSEGWRSFFERKWRGVTSLESAVDALNEIRDDETYAICEPPARTALITIAYGGPKARRALATLRLLCETARAIEDALDRLHALAPMKLLRKLDEAEDRGDDGEADEARARLVECDAIEERVAELRARLRTIADPGPRRVQAIAHRLGPFRKWSQQSSLPAPIEPIEPIEPGREVAGETARTGDRAVPPTVDAKIGDDAKDGDARVLALDEATFRRLARAAALLEHPRSIAEYRILGLLGSGGMGVVYEARSIRGTRLALKVMRGAGALLEDDSMVRRFRRECRLLAKIDHPACVRLVDYGLDGDEIFLALTLIDGATLASILEHRRLTLEETIGLGFVLAGALSALHTLGIVHRDLKPENVMVDRTGRAIITDFGISCAVEETRLTGFGEMVGTPGWVAPEVVLGAEPNPAADQWALGRILFFAVAPAQEDRPQGSFRSRLEAGTLIPWSAFPAAREWKGLRAVLERALAPEPRERFATIQEFAAALRMLGADGPVTWPA